jgi:hypothetical protein
LLIAEKDPQAKAVLNQKIIEYTNRCLQLEEFLKPKENKGTQLEFIQL